MTATHLILHQYDISPFSQKAQKMMGLKGLAWESIEMPLIAPKPDVEALTGGYRGTPILQLGADIYVDNWMIARALDDYDSSLPRLSHQDAHHLKNHCRLLTVLQSHLQTRVPDFGALDRLPLGY